MCMQKENLQSNTTPRYFTFSERRISLEVGIDSARLAAKHNCCTFSDVQYEFPISKVPMYTLKVGINISTDSASLRPRKGTENIIRTEHQAD